MLNEPNHTTEAEHAEWNDLTISERYKYPFLIVVCMRQHFWNFFHVTFSNYPMCRCAFIPFVCLFCVLFFSFFCCIVKTHMWWENVQNEGEWNHQFWQLLCFCNSALVSRFDALPIKSLWMCHIIVGLVASYAKQNAYKQSVSIMLWRIDVQFKHNWHLNSHIFELCREKEKTETDTRILRAFCLHSPQHADVEAIIYIDVREFKKEKKHQHNKKIVWMIVSMCVCVCLYRMLFGCTLTRGNLT